MSKTPKETIEQGISILAPFLESHGFSLNEVFSGESSGGDFGSCQFVNDHKVLELHFRYSLGLVSYRVGSVILDHSQFLFALEKKREYPGFSQDPTDGFFRLLKDLKTFGTIFLKGTENDFLNLATKYKENPPTTGFSAINRDNQ